MPLNELIFKSAKLYPQKEAVVCGNHRFNYQSFAKRIWRLSNSLSNIGLRKDDRVAILHENCHVFLEAYFAASHLGIILVPINFRLSAREVVMILQDSHSRLLITQGKFYNIIMGILEMDSPVEKIIWTRKEFELANSKHIDYELMLASESGKPPLSPLIDDNDVAQIYYTSGTTGVPKGVMLTHKNVKSHALGTIAELKLIESDHWLHAAPLFHLADAWATFAITWVGGKHILIPSFDSFLVLRLIEKEKITLSNLIPTMLNMMVNNTDVGKFDYSSLRVILSGGAPIAPETVRKIIKAFKCDYIQTYGMTETSPFLTMSILKENLKNLPSKEQLHFKAKTGREFINVSLMVVDNLGNEVTKDSQQVGEIIVKGDGVTPGYWNKPDETKKSIRDGWLYTGDLAVIDGEGYINIVDRKKDMIITGGENVYSTEVEYVLYMHPHVLEAAVIGVPDDRWGEMVKAYIVLKDGHCSSKAEIIEFCKSRLSHYKAPKKVEFVETLPKTGSGKIHKKSLRESYH